MPGGELAFILAAAAVFIAVVGGGFALTSGGDKRVMQRAAVVKGEGAAVRHGGAKLDQTAQKKRQIQDSLKEMEERQKQARKKSLTLRARIEQAGLEWSPTQFWIISGVLGFVGALGVLVAGQNILLVLAAGIVLGLGAPRWYLGMRRDARQKKFTEHFADALDIIVRGVKSGLPLSECLKVIARETPEPVGSEFAQLVEGISVGVDLEEGMRRMTTRMPLPELNFFATVLLIQQRTGGNLAEALGNLSGVLRARKMMREKIQALSSEAKASAFIIGSLPPGVLVIISLISPDYMGPMFTSATGQMMLLGGGLWMLMGILMMRGMINFKH
ncbi:MAG: type II secretion system F family protein [Pseudomonadota bacterium]